MARRLLEREHRMLKPVAALLAAWGCDLVVREVPYFVSRVDLLGICESGNVAVELKVRKWRIALKQARIRQLFAPLVYIAMPQEYVNRVLQPVLADVGVGLIAVAFRKLRPVTADCHVVLHAEESPILKDNHCVMMSTRARALGAKRWHRIELPA